MSTDQAYDLRQQLVDQLKEGGQIQSPPVEAAFRAVPRHAFVPDADLEVAYSDIAIKTKSQGPDGLWISSSSQPAIMAIMLEQLALQPGMRVLEIGAGTGYNAALLAHLIGEAGSVTTIDIDDDIAEGARNHLRAAGVERVQVITADGGHGYAPGAPYDRIIATVGAWDIPPAWWDQLAPQGRMALPLSIGGSQLSLALVRRGDALESVSAAGCGFMALRGAFASPYEPLDLGPQPLLKISIEQHGVDAEQVYRWLTGPYRDFDSGVETRMRTGLLIRLGLAEPGLFGIASGGASRERVPPLWPDPEWMEFRYSVGVLGEDGMCLFLRPPEPPDYDEPSSMHIRAFGPGGEALARRLIGHLQDYAAAGCPGGETIGVRVHRADAPVHAAPGETLIARRWTRLAVWWDEAGM